MNSGLGSDLWLHKYMTNFILYNDTQYHDTAMTAKLDIFELLLTKHK